MFRGALHFHALGGSRSLFVVRGGLRFGRVIGIIAIGKVPRLLLFYGRLAGARWYRSQWEDSEGGDHPRYPDRRRVWSREDASPGGRRSTGGRRGGRSRRLREGGR